MEFEGVLGLVEALEQAKTLVDDGSHASERGSTFLDALIIGSAGVGKSAVANSLIGQSILPTASDASTRCPIFIEVAKDGRATRGVWAQMPGRQPLMSAEEIRRAVQSDMSRWHLGKSKEEIRMTLHSPSALPLRVIDLPGVESKGELFAELGKHNDALLLVVLPATGAPNAAASPAVKLAQQLDPEGARSIGVLTKVDQAANDDRALAAATWLMQGRGPGWTGMIKWVGVVGQPPKDGKAATATAASSVDYDGTWRGELEVLRSLLKVGRSEEASTIGRMALVKQVGNNVKTRLKNRVPTVMAGLNGRSEEVQEDLVAMGTEMVETETGTRLLALELCRAMEQKFHYQLDHGEVGGARMVATFEGSLPGRFRRLPLDELFSFASVKQVVLEADGYQPFLLSPEKGLRALIRKSLELAKAPSVQCVDEVHRILVEAVSAAAASTPLLTRYPPMRRELVHIASEALEDFRVGAKDMVVAVVDMERSFIPPSSFGKLVARRMELLRREDDIRLERLRKEDEAKALRAAQAKDAEQKLLNQAVPAETTPPASAANTRSPSPTGGTGMLTGWLWKKSNKNDSWNRRWFVLNEKAVKVGYMKKPDDKAFIATISLEECVVDDLDDEPTGKNAPMRPKSAPAPAAPGATLQFAFKIRHSVSYKSLVKGHNEILLRAEQAEDKAEWLSRLRFLTPSGKESQKTPPPPAPDTSSSSTTASSSAKKGLFEKLGFSKDPMASTADKSSSGTGAVLERDLMRRRGDPDEDLKVMAQEVRDYVDAVLTQLAANVPKAIVLCQVEKAKETMLNKLYGAISSKPDSTIQTLLVEDGEVRAAREARMAQAETLSKIKRQLSIHEANIDDGSMEDSGVGHTPSMGGAEDWRVAFHEAGGGDSPDSVLDNAPTPPRPSPSYNARSGIRGSSSENDLAAPNGKVNVTANGGSPGLVRNPSRVPPPPPGARGYGF